MEFEVCSHICYLKIIVVMSFNIIITFSTYTGCFIIIHICALFLCVPFIIADFLLEERIGNLRNIDKSNLVQQIITYDAVTTIALSMAFVTVISFVSVCFKITLIIEFLSNRRCSHSSHR